MFTYMAHGMRIASEIALPELIPAPAEQPDVTIRHGEVPESLDKPLGRGVLYQAKKGSFLLQIEDIAKYLVTNGTTITIETAEESVDSDVRVFLYGSAFGALLHQRGVLVLHGSAVETPHGAVAFVGHSGSGKSTLAGAFVNRGYPLLNDDVCGVYTGSGSLQVHPGKPSVHLWADSLAKMETGKEDLERIRESIEKYRFPVGEQFSKAAVPLIAVYLLNSQNTDELSVTPLEGSKRVGVLVDHTYRVRFLDHMGVGGRHFMQTAQVAQKTRVCRIKRPRGQFRLDELVEMIEEDIQAGSAAVT